MKIPIIKSKKFTLRPFKKGDEESLAKNVNNKKIHKMVSNIQYPYSLENAKKWIKFNLNEYKKENHRSKNNHKLNSTLRSPAKNHNKFM